MTPLSTDLQATLSALVGLDPSATVVVYDAGSNSVTYSEAIRSDENRTKNADPEEVTRAATLALLSSAVYDYPPDCFYIEKRYTIGHPTTSGAEVDLIIYDEDGLPFAMWEMKEPGCFDSDLESAWRHQLFGTAPQLGEPRFLVYSTIQPSASPTLRCMVVDYASFKSFDSWESAGRPHSDAFPPQYRLPTYEPFTNGGTKDLNETFATEDFRAVAQAFHAEFFSEHPDTEVFSSLVKCLLAKILDERHTRRGDAYEFQVRNRNGKEEAAQAVFTRISDLYSRAYTHYIDRNGTDSLDPRVFPAERVKTVVKSLQGVALTRGAALHGDVIGAFFEEILRSGFKQDKGMYFTHSNLVWFILEALGLEQLTVDRWTQATHPSERMPYVIDPSCGSGSFLLRAMQIMTAAVRSRRDDLVADDDSLDFYTRGLPDHRPNAWAQDFIYGSDPKFVMAITAKVNMVLHGDGSAHIFKWDALSPFGASPDSRLKAIATGGRSLDQSAYRPDMCESFDVVVSNPPFGITLSPETRRQIPSSFSLPESSSSEALFLERWFQLLRPGGRLGVVMPESLLNTAESDAVRLFLYRCFWIRAIVALPRNLFVETPTLTSLLFAQKKTGDEIRAWDETWSAQEADLAAKVRTVSSSIRRLVSQGANPVDVQKLVLNDLASVVDERTVLSSPRSRSLIPMRLPETVTSVADAAAYYRAAFRSGPFAALIRNVVFARTAESSDYSFPTFMIEDAGYKLSKRGERSRPNELCQFTDEASGLEVTNLHLATGSVRVRVDEHNPTRVLDYIRKAVIWT